MAEPTPVYGSIDVGSNSVHLLVAALGANGLEPLVDESVFLGLGALVDRTGELGTRACRRLAVAIHRFTERARALGARTIVCIGTEPLRRAIDGPAIARAIGRLVGVSFDVLEHEEEGYLTLLGVDRGRRPRGELLVVDVGGGSTELVLVGQRGDVRAFGLQVGGARLTSRHVTGDPPTAAEIAALRHAAWQALEAAPPARPTAAVVVGGTATNLCRIVPGAEADRLLTPERLAAAMDELGRRPAAAAAATYGMNPVRAGVLPAGAAILEAIIARYGLRDLETSDASIREGAILAVAEGGQDWRGRLPSLAAGWKA